MKMQRWMARVLVASILAAAALYYAATRDHRSPNPSQLLGQTHEQVRSSLGNPNTQNDDSWVYNFPSLNRQITLEFQHGRVARVELCDRDCSDGRCFHDSTSITISSASGQP